MHATLLRIWTRRMAWVLALLTLVAAVGAQGDSVPLGRSAIFAQRANTVMSKATGRTLPSERWAVRASSSKGLTVTVRQGYWRLIFDQNGLFRLFSSGSIPERMKSGPSGKPLRWSDEQWYRKADGLARKLWAGFKISRLRIVRNPEDEGPPRRWSEWSSTVDVRFRAKDPEGRERLIGIVYDDSTAECLSAFISNPARNPIK